MLSWLKKKSFDAHIYEKKLKIKQKDRSVGKFLFNKSQIKNGPLSRDFWIKNLPTDLPFCLIFSKNTVKLINNVYLLVLDYIEPPLYLALWMSCY